MKKNKFNIKNSSYRRKLFFLAAGLIIGLCSLMFTNYIARQLSLKELNEIRLWSHAMTIVGETSDSELGSNTQKNLDMLIAEIVNNNTTIPTIVTDEDLNVLKHTNVPKRIIENDKLLRSEVERMAQTHDPIRVDVFNHKSYYIFYSRSQLLTMLRYFPYIQLGVIAIFVMFAYITFLSSKQDEQNRVWIGMAKETAHQLGTPTSSLLGWIEYLKSQNTEPFVIDEMSKDITRLLKVVDRFSKIGSVNVFVPRNVNDIVGNAVSYFQTRIPKNVSLYYDETASNPMQSMVNEALFEWVIENLLKNALDALQGKGSILVKIYDDTKWIYIDVKDSGKGINKQNKERIFNPGFTTKTRGWGLGLSLSRRIIQDYHKGKIFVADTELDKGTTMRIQLRRL